MHNSKLFLELFFSHLISADPLCCLTVYLIQVCQRVSFHECRCKFSTDSAPILHGAGLGFESFGGWEECDPGVCEGGGFSQVS
jgi:hypothetical protein